MKIVVIVESKIALAFMKWYINECSLKYFKSMAQIQPVVKLSGICIRGETSRQKLGRVWYWYGS